MSSDDDDDDASDSMDDVQDAMEEEDDEETQIRLLIQDDELRQARISEIKEEIAHLASAIQMDPTANVLAFSI